MVNDSGRYSALIKFLGLCILIKNANGNILAGPDANHCWQTVWENDLKCHNFVTLDSPTQNAKLTIPLQESAVGFKSPRSKGAQSPESYFGGFFYARLAWQLQMVGRAGASSDAPVPLVRSLNPVRSATLFKSGDGGKQMHQRSQPC